MNSQMEHEQVEQLLPWYANGALQPAERAEVAGHLEHCEACREELAFLGDVRAVLKISAARDQAPPTRNTAGFHSLPADLQQRVLAERSRGTRRRWMPALAAGFVASVGLGIALGVTWLDAPRFQTATSGEAAARPVRVAVTFAPDASLEELNALLREHGAVIVGGSENGERWVLDVPAGNDSTDVLLERLRASGGIAYAERVEQGQEATR